MEYKEVNVAKPQKYFVCHDGSTASDEALNTVHHGLLRDIDELIVSHAWSQKKEEYLKWTFKREHIRKEKEADFISMGKRFHYCEEEIKEEDGESAKTVLNSMAAERHATLMVVGFHGRKGPKEDPTIMGTAVQYMSLNSTAPVIIVKDPKTREQRPDGYTFGVCVDGSKQSLNAVSRLC